MEIWTTKEAARKLGVSERRIRQLIADDRIKAQKLGHIWAIPGMVNTKRKPENNGKEISQREI